MLLRLGAALAALSAPLHAQMPQFSISPMRTEVEVAPGVEKTVSFEIQGAPALTPERGRLILSVTDWKILDDGSLSFTKAASEEASASSWIIFSPAAFTLEAERTQLVRITIRVPTSAKPGVYRSALFIEERPPATVPAGERIVYARGRYAFVLYVIVPPVSPKPELVDADIDVRTEPARLILQMTNTGTRHVRPVVKWVIRRDSVREAYGAADAAVLLPGATVRQAYALRKLNLTPGKHEISAVVDFQDGSPLQSMTRSFEIGTTPPGPPPAQ
jgi:P pilus assembly chaperone PapD